MNNSGSILRVKKQDVSATVCFSCQLEVTDSVVLHSSDREHVHRGLSVIILKMKTNKACEMGH
jgi:hypothetical protein